MRGTRTVAFALLCATGAAGSAGSETLPEAISLAYESNPAIQVARANQRATDEEYPQARAGLRPSVQAIGQIVYDQSKTAAQAPGSESTSGAFIQFSQPVYSGGRLTNAIDAASADVLAGREALRQVEIQLLQSVIKAYVDVRRDRIQLDIQKESVQLLRHQLDEANARLHEGDGTLTDTSQAQARLAQGETQLASAEAQLVVSRAEYRAIVGQDPGELAPEPPLTQLPATVEAALNAADRGNPQIMQARYIERASAARLAEAKSAHLPSVSLQASVGYAGGVTPFGLPANSPFSNFARDITVQAAATIPLYTGGLTSSQIRQAAERNDGDRINIDSVRRQIAEAMDATWGQLVAGRASLGAFQRQVDADAIAYEGTREEEQQDLRTTLDVLNAEQELENAKLSLTGAQHDVYVDEATVLATMGVLDVSIFAPSEPRYDPADHFKRVSDSGALAPWEAMLEGLDRIGPSAAPTASGLPTVRP
jgi:outer membrane protein